MTMTWSNIWVEKDTTKRAFTQNVRRCSLMVIPRIKEKLQKYPDVTYTARADYLEIPAQGPEGFRVWVQERPGHYTVGFEGWHEEFTEAGAAIDCFAFGLSPACRLSVFRRGSIDYKWQVLHQVDGQWIADSETGLFFFPFGAGERRESYTMTSSTPPNIRLETDLRTRS